MKQSVSHYVMPDEKEEATAELVHRLGLDGIENLIYGDEPSSNLFTSLTVGAHLRFWPRWMDFYLGNTKRYKKPRQLTTNCIDLVKYISYYLTVSRTLEAKWNRLAGSLNNVDSRLRG